MKIIGRVAIGSTGGNYRRDAHAAIISPYIYQQDYPQVTARARFPSRSFRPIMLRPASVSASLLLPRAMIDLSVKDAITHFRRGRPTADSQDAMGWITSRDNDPMTFNWCCWTLGIEPEHYRKAVLAKIWHARNVEYSRQLVARNEPIKSHYFPQNYGRQSRQPRRLLDGL